jgi:hypothetical protein
MSSGWKMGDLNTKGFPRHEPTAEVWSGAVADGDVDIDVDVYVDVEVDVDIGA